jgi:hypothetical protein
MSDTALPDRRNTRPPVNKWAIAVLLGATVSIVAPVLFYYVKTTEPDRFWALVILAISPALIAAGAYSLIQVEQPPRMLMVVVGASEFAKGLLLFGYTYELAHERSPLAIILAGAALCAALILVSTVFWLTTRIMRYTVEVDTFHNDLSAEHHEVVEQILRHRLVSIGAVLVGFLQVAVFLALALAFHDLAMGRGALHRVVQKLKIAIPDPAALTPSPQTAEAGKSSEPNVYLFSFAEGSASLQCSSKGIDPLNLDGDEFYGNPVQAKRIDYLRPKVPGPCQSELPQMAWNFREIHALRKWLADLYKDKPFERYRGVVVAHATKDPPQSEFVSNYEISSARAEQVQAIIESMTASLQRESKMTRAPFNLEWLLLPAGHGETSLLGDKHQKLDELEAAGLNRYLVAEVEVLQIPRHLTTLQAQTLLPDDRTELLDYLYFMIAAAGYGDVIPTTGFAQFLICISKIFECFFVIVAFNVILALRREMTTMENRKPDRGAET